MKAVRSHRNISPHGGIVPILKKIKELGVPQVIRKCLGKRKKQAKYGYEDVFIAWILTAFCGGKRLEHISKIKNKLAIIPDLKIPSHDTLGRVMKKMAAETITEEVKQNYGISHTDYDNNINLNNVLIKTTKQIGALKEGVSYTLDIDATFIPTECRGAIRKFDSQGKLEYGKIGFNPMVCLIKDLPVFISMRNGDAAARFDFMGCLKNCLNLLEQSNIKIGRVISDAAGYNKEAFEMLEAKGIKFITRFPYQKKMETFKANLNSCTNWRSTEIETANLFWKCEIADIYYKMFDRPETGHISPTWRVVTIRIPTQQTSKRIDSDEELERKKRIKNKMKSLAKNKLLKEQGKAYEDKNWKENDGYTYKFFITNDMKSKSEDIIIEYNKRGDAERKFSFMKNDFAWRLPPFMLMNQNTVFMITAALANNVFRGIVKQFKKQIPELRLNARLPDFQFVFINVACEYLNGIYTFFNTNMAYEKIM